VKIRVKWVTDAAPNLSLSPTMRIARTLHVFYWRRKGACQVVYKSGAYTQTVVNMHFEFTLSYFLPFFFASFYFILSIHVLTTLRSQG